MRLLKMFWAGGWILFMLSHILLLIGGMGESNATVRELAGIISWFYFGVIPVLAISLVSPILTSISWRKLSRFAKIHGLVYPLELFLGFIVSALIVSK